MNEHRRAESEQNEADKLIDLLQQNTAVSIVELNARIDESTSQIGQIERRMTEVKEKLSNLQNRQRRAMETE